MKKKIITLHLVLLFIGANAQVIYNNGAYIKSESGSYWVVDKGNFTLTSSSSSTPTQLDYLNITRDASLTLGTVSTPAYLTVNNNFTITSGGSFTIKSGSSGTSSLIVGGDFSGTATVERYITGVSNSWHLLSSPVTSQVINGDFTPDGSVYDFYLYNEPTNEWINRKNLEGGTGAVAPYFDVVNGNLSFTPGRGYLVAYNVVNTKSYVGTINQNTISQSVTIGGSTQYQGANLLGNPYPNSLDWKASEGWTRDMLKNDADPGPAYSMYIWNETAGNYGTFVTNGDDESGTNNVTRYIPPMQGFFVMAATAGSFQMTEAVCVHDNTASWLKSSPVSPYVIKLKAFNNEYGFDEVVLQDDEINKGGAQKWFSFVETAPSLWIDFEDELYSILLDNVNQEENHYPIGFKPGIEEQYTLTASFDAGAYTDLILVDKKLSKYHNLLESQSYSFYSSPQDNPDRFILRFSTVGLDDLENTPNPLQVFSKGKTITIINNSNILGEIMVVNIIGQKTSSYNLCGDNTQKLTLSIPAGVYIVHIKTDQGNIYSEKIIINN